MQFAIALEIFCIRKKEHEDVVYIRNKHIDRDFTARTSSVNMNKRQYSQENACSHIILCTVRGCNEYFSGRKVVTLSLV